MYRKWGRTKPPPGASLDRGHPLAQQMLGVWLANEGSGRVVRDLMNGRNGAWSALPLWPNGKLGGPAMRFTGGINSVQIADNNLWDPLGDFTLLSWVYYSVVSASFWLNSMIALDQGGGNQTKWIFCVDPAGPGTYFFYYSGASQSIRSAAWTPAANIWYQLAVTRRGALWTLYRNGVFDGITVNAVSLANAAIPLTIGFAEANSLNGLVDHVMMWNRALSAVEISQLYQEPFAMILSPRSISYFVPQAFNPGRNQPGVVIGGGCI